MKTSSQVSLKKMMISKRLPLRKNLAARFAAIAGGCMTIGSAYAQSCPAPLLLNSSQFFAQIDTCQSTYAPEKLCGGEIFPDGPAVVFQINIGYPQPTYTFVAQPLNGAVFDPVIVVESQHCGETGNCPFQVDNAGVGMEETFNFGQLDSGTYYLVVTSVNQDAPCGLTYFGFETGVIEDTDGIFRSGMN